MKTHFRRATWEKKRKKDASILKYREGIGHPLQYSFLENPMDRGA